MRLTGIASAAVLSLAGVTTAISACATSGPGFRVTRWAPDQQGFGCPLEMMDPESGAILSVVRIESIVDAPVDGGVTASGQDTVGDYAVKPAGALGVKAEELARVDCKTRRIIRIVPAGR